MQCALIYDFDGTLAKGNCAEHGLMPALGLNEHPDFWPEVNRKNRERDGDEILTYLGELAKRAHDEGKRDELKPENLQAYGKSIPLFPGVVDWFDAINRFASDQGIALSHYIVSSGLEEMIRGTPVAKHFKKILGAAITMMKPQGMPSGPL